MFFSGEDVLVQVFGELDLGETAYFGLRYQDGQNQTVRKSKMKFSQ